MTAADPRDGLPERVLALLDKHGGWQATLDYIANLEALAHARPEAVDEAMVERGARAICEAHGWNPEEPVKYSGTNRIARERDGSPTPQWKMHEFDARAALTAALTPERAP